MKIQLHPGEAFKPLTIGSHMFNPRWVVAGLIAAASLTAQAQTPPGVIQMQQAEARRVAEEKVCQAQARKAGLPADLINAMYLYEVNSPVPFAEFACAAANNGVTFRYQSGGVFGSESFEIKGKKTVSVKVKRSKLDDGRVLLIPVQYTANGDSQEVVRTNIQLLSFHLRSALGNE